MGHLIVWNVSGWCVYDISVKIRFFVEFRDNKTSELDNEEKSAKEFEREEENEEITSSKSLEMTDKLKMYYPRKAIPDAHPPSPKYQK